MKQKLLIAFLILSAAKNLTAQNVGIGTTTPHTSAVLEIKDTTKGILIPRMTTAQRDAIVSPAVGLMILNLDDKCADVYNGTTWIKNCGFTAGIDTIPAAWTQKADFGGTGRQRAVGFSIGSKGYIGTGNDGALKKDFWEYDPSTNSWAQKADFAGTGRYEAVGFSIDSKGYIGTGDDGVKRNDFWEYDPGANAWTQKTDFGGTARRWAVGFTIGSKGYIGTGDDGAYKKDFWEYNPAGNSWTQKADFGGVQRVQAAGFGIGSKGYLGTGFDGAAGKKDFWEYDTVSNLWTQKTDFGGTASWSRAGFSIGSKGYLGTGFDGTNRKDFWEYDAGANAWTQKSDFGGTARYAAIGFSIGTKGYIGTGFDAASKKDFWEYNLYPIGNSYSNIINTSNYYTVNGGLWVKTGDTLKNANAVSIISISGNTGIGTTIPTQKLDVVGNATISGNIGIGTTTPSQKLHVVGNVSISGNTGIGTAAPAYPLHITSASPLRTAYFLNTSNAGDVVWGINTATAGTGNGAGVIGITSQNGPLAAGVWGENPNVNGTGIIGLANGIGSTVLANGSGGAFTGNVTGVYARSATSQTGQAIYSDQFGAIVRVNYYNGTQFKINGVGTVSTVVTGLDNKKVTMYAPEAPEIYFQDYGAGQLINGRAHIDIDPVFAKNVTINDKHPLRVFVQLEGDCKGVYVTNKTPAGFDVVELNGGTSNIPFQWTITCNRADEVLSNGRISRNADMRFGPAGEPLPVIKQETKLAKENK